MSILVGHLAADGGTIELSASMGFCPQQPVVYPRLTCDEHFELVAGAYRVTGPTRHDAKASLYDELGFGRFAETPKRPAFGRDPGQVQSRPRSAVRHRPAALRRAVRQLRLGYGLEVPGAPSPSVVAGPGPGRAHHQPLHRRRGTVRLHGQGPRRQDVVTVTAVLLKWPRHRAGFGIDGAPTPNHSAPGLGHGRVVSGKRDEPLRARAAHGPRPRRSRGPRPPGRSPPLRPSTPTSTAVCRPRPARPAGEQASELDAFVGHQPAVAHHDAAPIDTCDRAMPGNVADARGHRTGETACRSPGEQPAVTSLTTGHA
jgi:hypothetical protein